MYKSFFGTRALPFGPSRDPRFLFLRPQIKPIPAHIVESIGLELDLVRHPFAISSPVMQALTGRTLQTKPAKAVGPSVECADAPKESDI